MDDNKTVTATFTQNEYTIVASADPNGVIDPNGSIVKTYGQDQQFTACPNIGYAVDKWYLDGNDVQTGGSSYTLINITADHAVLVTFRRLPRDDFNDNRRSAMWRTSTDDPESTNVIEDANRLNVISTGGFDMAAPCVGHWKMNDNAANTVVVDSSGKGNNGTAQRNTSVLHIDSGNPPHLNGAFIFNGSGDYVNVGSVIGSGAYTKVAWVKRTGGAQNNIISSASTWSNFFWAPQEASYKLSAGHNYGQPGGGLFLVQDTEPLEAGRWYLVAVTFDPNVESGKMVLYKNGVKVDDANNVPTQLPDTTYIGRFLTGYYFSGSIDNVMIFNRALSADEISYLYNNGDGTETIPARGGHGSAFYSANGWKFDVNEDFEVKVDFHYSDTSSGDGWVEMALENTEDNYVSLSAGFDGNQTYLYYEKAIDGNVVYEQASRASNDGTLYISYNASLDELYLSFTGYGSGNAWQTITGLLAGQWSSGPVSIAVGGGSGLATLEGGEAYLDNFEVNSGLLLGWPPATDLDSSGFIDWSDVLIISGNWLATGSDIPGDIVGDDDIVNFRDFAELGLAW
jgi:hypothetical protein